MESGEGEEGKSVSQKEKRRERRWETGSTVDGSVPGSPRRLPCEDTRRCYSQSPKELNDTIRYRSSLVDCRGAV